MVSNRQMMIARLRTMIADEALPQDVRSAAADRLAKLGASANDGGVDLNDIANTTGERRNWIWTSLVTLSEVAILSILYLFLEMVWLRLRIEGPVHFVFEFGVALTMTLFVYVPARALKTRPNPARFNWGFI